jgi:hypothetical protein
VFEGDISNVLFSRASISFLISLQTPAERARLGHQRNKQEISGLIDNFQV